MSRALTHPLPWSDADLSDAIKASASWAGVMRALGYGDRSKSAGAIRIVRRRAVDLNLDSSHFRGKRRWSDADLRQAVGEAHSWGEVISRLGLSAASGNVQPHIKSHAVRLGLDTAHLNPVSHRGPGPSVARPEASELRADMRFLRVAAAAVGASWFALRGCAVSLPVEPTVYDLLVESSAGISRVQIKTTAYATTDGWTVTVGHHPDTHAKNPGRLVAYDPDVIDLFFIIDGDMTLYLIPSRALAGRVRVLLRTYRKYVVGNAAGLLGAGADAAEGAAASA